MTKPEVVTLPPITQDEYDSLLLILGYAAGAAMERKESGMAKGIFRLANRLNRNNPKWRPYEIDEEETDGLEAI